ncbi:hypothetical protein ABPG77_006011 [Micractinium sp. CCAP 211/92]
MTPGFNPGSTTAILDDRLGFSSISATVLVNTPILAGTASISTLLVPILHRNTSLGMVVGTSSSQSRKYGFIMGGLGALPFILLLNRLGLMCVPRM